MLAGRQQAILDARDAKLKAAREARAKARALARENIKSENARQSSSESYDTVNRSEDKALLGSTLSTESTPVASDDGTLATTTVVRTC